MNSYIAISNIGLAISICIMFLFSLFSYYLQNGLSKVIIIATIRSFFQLMLMGFVLNFIFINKHWYYSISLFLIMISFAAWDSSKRIDFDIKHKFLISFIPITIGSVIPISMFLYLIIRISPWFDPQYLIPAGGMIVANTMTAVTLSLNNFLNNIKESADEIESRLSLGASTRQAIQRYLNKAIFNGLIPPINGLMILGIAKLPGMMTGQIISGIDTISAVKYQLVVMHMVFVASTIGIYTCLHLSIIVIFNKRMQLQNL